MSEFHYVRTLGPSGGVDAAEGPAIGIDLNAVLDAGLPPISIALTIVAAVAEILAIAEEDGVVHGDLEPRQVFIDDTGAVSIEGFGATVTQAPESTPHGSATDRYGLGSLLYSLLSPHDLPELPNERADYDDAVIDTVLLINLEGLPDQAVSDLQWYLVRLLALEPNDRPTTVEAWRVFAQLYPNLQGPDFAQWCHEAIDGGAERRDSASASIPMRRGPIDERNNTTVSGGPLPRGSMNFSEVPGDEKNTGWWTPDGMKNALQRALTSDYLEDPDTGWMPGTPLPPLDRSVAPDEVQQSLPRRAPGVARQRRDAPPTPDSTFSATTYDDFTHPMGDRQKQALTDDAKTIAGSLGVPLNQHTPAPVPDRRHHRPTLDAPTVPAPGGNRPKRKTNAPPKDPDTKPEFVDVRGVPSESIAPLPVRPPTPAPPARHPTPEPAPASRAPLAASAPGPVPMPDLSRGPDPFANAPEETPGPNVPLLATIGVLVVMLSFLCVGSLGVGGITAMMGFPTDKEGVATAPTPRKVRPKPSLKNVPKPLPSPSNFKMPERPTGTANPRPTPLRPAPRRPAPERTTRARPAPPPPSRPAPVLPRPVRPVPAPFPTPAPTPFARAAPAPFPTPAPPPSIPSLPKPDSLLPTLLPPTEPGPNGEPPSALRQSMAAHFTSSTAARDAVIRGDTDAAKRYAAELEFLQQPATLPPSWQPYVVDLRTEAWLMGNSPDLAAAGFKVAQIGSACASCHAGVHAGPTITPNQIPPRQFPNKDVMRKHAWALDWMWVGLIANDDIAWDRGAKELSEAPFASAVLEGFPEPGFVKLEDKLHGLAMQSRSAVGPDRAATYGQLLATCASCHVLYRTK